MQARLLHVERFSYKQRRRVARFFKYQSRKQQNRQRATPHRENYSSGPSNKCKLDDVGDGEVVDELRQNKEEALKSDVSEK